VLLTPVANEGKIFNQESFYYFFWTPLGSTVELAYRYIFSFKFTLSCQQFDIFPNVCPKFAASVVETGVNLPQAPVDIGGKFAAGVNDAGGKQWE